jgi:hypothetical protein
LSQKLHTFCDVNQNLKTLTAIKKFTVNENKMCLDFLTARSPTFRGAIRDDGNSVGVNPSMADQLICGINSKVESLIYIQRTTERYCHPAPFSLLSVKEAHPATSGVTWVRLPF